MLQAAPLPAPTAVPGEWGEARLLCRRPGRAPPGADRKSSSGWGRPVQIRYFVPLPKRGGWRGRGRTSSPGEAAGAWLPPALAGLPPNAPPRARQPRRPGVTVPLGCATSLAQPRSPAASSLFPSPSSPRPAWSPEQRSPRTAPRRCLGWRGGGKPLSEEAGSPRAPVGLWSLPPAAAAFLPPSRCCGEPASPRRRRRAPAAGGRVSLAPRPRGGGAAPL